MAIVVTADLTLVNTCDSTTGWSGGNGHLEIDTGVKKQGTASMSDWINATTSTVCYVTIASASLVGKHLLAWLYCSGVVDTKANGGYRLYLATDASNWSVWYVGGVDTVETKWNLFTIDPTKTRDEGAGTLNLAAITRVGVQFKTTSVAVKKGQTYINNCYWDVLRYGTGLTVKSASTDGIELEDIFAIDDLIANKYGIIQKVEGAYICNGALVFGDTGSSSIDLDINNQIMLYTDNDLVADTFNKIQILGNSTGNSNFSLVGAFIKANNVKALFDVQNVNLDLVSVIGCTFVNCDWITFLSGHIIDSDKFVGCYQVTPNSATFFNNTMNETLDTDGALRWTSDCDADTCFFNDNTIGPAIVVPASVTSMTVTSHSFSGNDVDIYWEGTVGTLAVNASTDTLVTDSAGGTVTVVAGQRTLTVTIKDGAVTPAVTFTDESVNVAIYADTGGPLTAGTEILKTLTNTSGQVSDTRSWASDQPITGWARRASSSFGAHTAGSGTTYFKEGIISGTISSSGDTDITILLASDE